MLSCNSTWPTHLEKQQVHDSCQNKYFKSKQVWSGFHHKNHPSRGWPMLAVVQAELHWGSRCHRECYEWWTIPREIRRYECRCTLLLKQNPQHCRLCSNCQGSLPLQSLPLSPRYSSGSG